MLYGSTITGGSPRAVKICENRISVRGVRANAETTIQTRNIALYHDRIECQRLSIMYCDMLTIIALV